VKDDVDPEDLVVEIVIWAVAAVGTVQEEGIGHKSISVILARGFPPCTRAPVFTGARALSIIWKKITPLVHQSDGITGDSTRISGLMTPGAQYKLE